MRKKNIKICKKYKNENKKDNKQLKNNIAPWKNAKQTNEMQSFCKQKREKKFLISGLTNAFLVSNISPGKR